MLKDIQNKSNMKRTISDDCISGLLTNAKTGEKFNINTKEEFSIGRYLHGSLVLEAAYISRRHCMIKYINNKFIIYDNNSNSGTFLNFEKLKKGIDCSKTLNDGDLITFGDNKKMEFIYKFSLLFSNVDKRLRLDEDSIEDKYDPKHLELVENSRKSLKIIQSDILKLKDAKQTLSNEIKFKLAEFQEMFKKVEKYVTKFNTELKKKNDLIEDLTKKPEYLDTANLLRDEIKNELNHILETDLLCSICNEIIVKIHTANCNHSFCECCIKEWLSKNQMCPICRTDVTYTIYSLTVDNLTTNIFTLLGGTIKEQRDNLLKERNESSKTKKKGRGRPRRLVAATEPPSSHSRQLNSVRLNMSNLLPVIPIEDNITELYNSFTAQHFTPFNLNRQSNIEVVDLTNTSR